MALTQNKRKTEKINAYNLGHGLLPRMTNNKKF